MNINIPTNDEALEILKRALRVSVEDYNAAQQAPRLLSEHGKDILVARQALELGIFSGPGCCYDHHLAPDRDKYLKTAASDKDINDIREAARVLANTVTAFRSIVPSGLHVSPKYHDMVDAVDKVRALLP